MEKIFSIGINSMSLAVWLGEDIRETFFHLILIFRLPCQLFSGISGISGITKYDA